MHSTRERILEKACKIFYENGYRATSLDALSRLAGVSKSSLYHHFPNKSAIVEAALLYASQTHRKAYLELWGKEGLTNKDRLLIMFQTMQENFERPDFYGCPFLNAATEFTDRFSTERRICEQHYQFIAEKLEGFARDSGLLQPKMVAEQITMLMMGAYISWIVTKNNNAAQISHRQAQDLIENALEMPA